MATSAAFSASAAQRDSTAENPNSEGQSRHFLALSGNPEYAHHNGELDRRLFAMASTFGGSGVRLCTTGDRLSQMKRKKLYLNRV
jgi:hypothetical protein